MSRPPCQRHPTTSRRSSSKNLISLTDQSLSAALMIIPCGILSSGFRCPQNVRLRTAMFPHHLPRVWLIWRSADFLTFPSSNWNHSRRARPLHYPSCPVPGGKVSFVLAADSLHHYGVSSKCYKWGRVCLCSFCSETGSEGGAKPPRSSLLLKHRPGYHSNNAEPCCSSGVYLFLDWLYISRRSLFETSHFFLQNIGGVVAAVAQLLRVPVPGDYQLSRSTVADHGSLALLAGVCMPLTRVLKQTWNTIF